jgi:hypothetical protein
MLRKPTFAFLGPLAILSLLAIVSPAAASHETIPPENSGVGQYTENVPGAGGDKPSDDLGGGSGSGGSGSGSSGSDAGLPPGTADALDSLASKGPVGAAAAGLARAGASDNAQGGGAGRAGSPGSAGEDDGSFLGETFGQLTDSDSDGMGIALPIVLGLSLVAAAVLVLARRRRVGQRTHQP